MPKLVALAVCAMIACNFGGGARSERAESDGMDRQQEEQAIRAMETRWRDILQRKDTAAIAAFYTEDAVYSPHGRPAYRGRDSVVSRWSREFQTPSFKLERKPIRIEVAQSGDLASEVGTCDVEFRAGNRLRRPSCTYMTTWRKTDGEWKVASYIWNDDTTKVGR